MSDEDFNLDSIIEKMAVILGVPKLELSYMNIGETGPLKTYHISKCCCFQKTKNVDEEKE